MNFLLVLLQLVGLLELLLTDGTGEKPGGSVDDRVGASLFKLASLPLDVSTAEFLFVSTENASFTVRLQAVGAFFAGMSPHSRKLWLVLRVLLVTRRKIIVIIVFPS